VASFPDCTDGLPVREGRRERASRPNQSETNHSPATLDLGKEKEHKKFQTSQVPERHGFEDRASRMVAKGRHAGK